MRSSMLRGPRLLSILACMTLGAGLSACASPRVVFQNASPCSDLVPDEWRKGVASAPPPQQLEVGQWVAFGDAQTGNLDTANGRLVDSLGIIEGCERRDAELISRLRRPSWWPF